MTRKKPHINLQYTYVNKYQINLRLHVHGLQLRRMHCSNFKIVRNIFRKVQNKRSITKRYKIV